MTNDIEAVMADVKRIVADHAGISPSVLTPDTTMQGIGFTASDLDEILEQLGNMYGVDLSGYRWYYHLDPDGFNPLWLIWKPLWRRVRRIPVTVRDLAESCLRGRWVVRYP